LKQTKIETSFRSDLYYILGRDSPLWISILNLGSLSGILVYPIVVIATYARVGDYSFYQPTNLEHLIIYIYPILLLIITFFSHKMVKFNKIIAAALPLAIIIYYFYLVKSGVLFEIRHDTQ
jgi:hypothetical protein